MPRLPDRIVARMQVTSSLGARLSPNEVSTVTATEARAVARQAIDAVDSTATLTKLRGVLGSEPFPAPLSSLRDLPSGRRWLDGAIKIGPSSPLEDVRVLQRALMKI